MLARIRKSMQEKDRGFTLIELLVVMIIIGILAAIAIPVFLNQRTKARETSAKADVSTIGKEIAAYYVDGTDALDLTTDATTDEWVLSEATGGAEVTRGALSGNNVATEP
ncbi:type II secretion system protein [Quadrisphaera sp. GCM10027208]|uniref:type II secretion system protein n=1 Tax=Quadrisphaera sp. GCM10027208 TaxID=3273423 RepID=UPI003622396A